MPPKSPLIFATQNNLLYMHITLKSIDENSIGRRLVLLYKATINGSLPPPISAHSKPSHHTYKYLIFKPSYLAHFFIKLSKLPLYLTLELKTFPMSISSSSNSKPFVCSEHLKKFPSSLPTFGFMVIADTIGISPW